MRERVLVIDPDDLQRRRIVRELKEAEIEVAEASGGVDGLLDILEKVPDVVVIAEELPPLEVADILSVVGRLTDVPLIVLGSGGEPAEVAALEGGADAYLRRPLRAATLLAWARALLRRYRPSSTISGVHLQLKGLARALTSTEKRLLVCLAANGDGLTSQGELLTRVWGGDTSPDTAKFYLRRLRHKLEEAACGPRLVSVRGVGHRLVQASTEAAGVDPGPYERRAV
ncbi:MAG: hypothetical protein GTO22_09745 [Gemmatimonadales bacterium]|nr:hypothetical protein [Gemmatimonadales bacterium]